MDIGLDILDEQLIAWALAINYKPDNINKVEANAAED